MPIILADGLSWIAGSEADSIPEGAKIEFGFTNMPQSWGVFVLIGIVVVGALAVYALYRREIETCPTSVKMLLATLRFVVLLVLVGVFLGPSLQYVTERTREPFVAVMRDASQSMNTPTDGYPDEQDAARAAAAQHSSVSEVREKKPTRVQIVNELLHHDNDRLLRELQRKGKVRIADFSDHLDARETLPAARPEGETQAAAAAESHPGVTKLVAEGRGTDLSLAIKEGLSLNPLAAVVIFTDGQNTAQDNPLEAAKEAKAKGIPLFFVGAGDPSRPRDLAVKDIAVPTKAWPKEPFEITALISADQLEPRDVRVDLIEQRLPEGDAPPPTDLPPPVDTQTLTLPAGGGQLRHVFSHAVDDPGKYVYTVRIEELDDDQEPSNNSRTSKAAVQVLNRERIHVLLVAGAPTWEYRLVQKLLAREKRTVELSCWLQTLDEERAQEGTKVITKLPVTQKELFAYDVIMLFDPNPQEFDEPWIELLKKFAGENSGGVLYMAGPKYSARFLTGQRTNKMRDILPVRFGDLGANEVSQLLSTNKQAWPLRIMSKNVDHPVMSFYQDPQENLARWEGLPGIFWSFPALDAKPTANVLVEHSDPTLRRVEGSRPLMVTGRFGAANTMYIGFNGTWRWRQAGRNAEFFDKFWIQATRYLFDGRALGGNKRVWLQTDKGEYQIGDKVTISARLKDSSFDPLIAPLVEASVEVPGGSPLSLQLRPITNQPGEYEGAFTARSVGTHKLRVNLPASSEGAVEGSAEPVDFSVVLPAVETRQTFLNKPLLRDLAAASGGAYFEVNELDKLAAAIPHAAQTIEVPGKPILLWSSSLHPKISGVELPIRYDVLVLLVLVIPLCAEWAVRKAYKLL